MAGKGEEEVESQEVNKENETQEKHESEKIERVNKLPLTRIKHIIKMDPDVTLASQDAVLMIAKAAELFVRELAKESYVYTVQGKRKTVQRKDMDLAVESVDPLAFLEGARVVHCPLGRHVVAVSDTYRDNVSNGYSILDEISTDKVCIRNR